MAAQGHYSTAGTPDIAQQKLHNRPCADNLYTLRLLRPADRVTEGRGTFASGVLNQRLHNLHPLFARDAADTLHHFRCVACEMVAHNLEHTLWVLQCWIG